MTATTTPAVLLSVLDVQRVGGLGPAKAGLLFAPFNLAVIGGSLAAPRTEPRRTIPAGLAAVASGCGLLAVSGTEPTSLMLLAFAIMGAGLGVASVASTASAFATTGPDRHGLASGVLNTAAQLGTAIGLAVVVAPAAAHGFRWGWAGCATLALTSSAAMWGPVVGRGSGSPGASFEVDPHDHALTGHVDDLRQPGDLEGVR